MKRLATLLLAATIGLAGQPTAAWAAGDEEAVPAYGEGHLTVKATAYTSGPESTGKRPGDPAFGITASGHEALEGHTIAVDPRVIPLGSRVYIEELGEYRYAEDTGGAIKGRKVDLYMEDVGEALKWGIQTIRIRVDQQI